MNVVIFVRVSKQSQDFERQIHDLRLYAERQGWTVLQIISEKISGTKKNVERHGINDLLLLARSGIIKKVLVTEISRLGRRTSEVLTVIEELSEFGVSVYAQNYNLETLTPQGKRNPIAALLFTFLAEFARLERETLVERIHSGLEQARRKGKILGRPKGTSEETEVVLKKYSGAVGLLKKGYSVRKVAKIHGISPTTVAKVKKRIMME